MRVTFKLLDFKRKILSFKNLDSIFHWKLVATKLFKFSKILNQKNYFKIDSHHFEI
jgi:hypothetical protein